MSSADKLSKASKHCMEHLAGIAQILDDKTIHELILRICCDRGIVCMLYNQEDLGLTENEEPDWYGLLEQLNLKFWVPGMEHLREHLQEAKSKTTSAAGGAALESSDTA